MSNRRKNNHYHYAEKFEDRRRAADRKRAFMPFKSVVISLVVLLMFGFVTLTFSAYVSEGNDAAPSDPSPIISAVRNRKADRDIALTGANAGFAGLGATWSFSGTSYMYFDNTTTGWTDKYIYLIIGKDSYSSVYSMSKVANTNYYVVQLPSSGWSDANYMAVIGNSSTWGSGNWGKSNLVNATHRTAAYTSGLSASDKQRYVFTPSSSSNGCTLSLDYKGEDNAAMDTVILKAHACHNSDGSTYVEDDATGGTVKISSYYFSAYNTVSTSDTGDGDKSAEYKAAKTTSAKYSTFTATAATGYRFVGWYNAATGGSLVSSNASYSYSTNSGDEEVYARFIKCVTISTAKNPAAYTGSPSASPSTAVDVGTEVTLTADVKTGVTFGGWTTSSGAAYTTTSGSSTSSTWKIKPTSSFTATAKYTLNKPTGVSLSYPPIVAGSTSTPTKSATSPAGSNGTLTYRFTNIVPQSDTTAASGTYSVDSTTGVVSATTPGKYTVTMTVTTGAYGLTSAAVSQTATVTVKPVAPTRISVEATNADSGDGTFAVPYKIPVDRTKFNIKSYIPIEDRNTDYTYNWTRTDGTYLLSNGNITAGTASVTTEDSYVISDTASSGSATTDVIHNAILEGTKGYIYKIAVTSNQNGVSSDTYYYTIYYGVTADFLVVESFDFRSFNSEEPIQKIYSPDNTIDHIDATYDAGGTKFDTLLKFSADRIVSKDLVAWTDHNSFTINTNPPGSILNYIGTHSPLPNDADHRVSSLIETISTIARNNVNLMQTTGPKWFGAYVDDYNNSRIGAQVPNIHTTVGTSSTIASRPIYYVDNTGMTFANSRVMAFYLVESDTESIVHYQTAEIVSNRSNTYRFYIPSDATMITFAHVSDRNYVLPSYDSENDSFNYAHYDDHTVLMAWTQTVDLSLGENAGKNTFSTDTSGTADSHGIYSFDGTMTTLS